MARTARINLFAFQTTVNFESKCGSTCILTIKSPIKPKRQAKAGSDSGNFPREPRISASFPAPSQTAPSRYVQIRPRLSPTPPATYPTLARASMNLLKSRSTLKAIVGQIPYYLSNPRNKSCENLHCIQLETFFGAEARFRRIYVLTKNTYEMDEFLLTSSTFSNPKPNKKSVEKSGLDGIKFYIF